MTAFNIKDLDKAILEAQQTVERLKERRQKLSEMTDEQKLTIFLHHNQCVSDHAADCSWYYEIKNENHDWTGYTHKKYYEKAKKALNEFDYDTIINVIELTK